MSSVTVSPDVIPVRSKYCAGLRVKMFVAGNAAVVVPDGADTDTVRVAQRLESCSDSLKQKMDAMVSPKP